METDDGPLLASAIATTLVGRRANNVVSQGRCLVPWIRSNEASRREPWQQRRRPGRQEEDIAPKPDGLALVFGMVLEALTIPGTEMISRLIHGKALPTEIADQIVDRTDSPGPSDPPAALALDRKKLAAFSAVGGGFLLFPIGDRRCNRTRARVGNAGGNARPSLTNATLAASRLLHRRSPTASPRARPR